MFILQRRLNFMNSEAEAAAPELTAEPHQSRLLTRHYEYFKYKLL